MSHPYPDPVPVEQPPQRPRSLTPYIVAGLIILAALIGLIFLLNRPGAGEDATPVPPTGETAVTAASSATTTDEESAGGESGTETDPAGQTEPATSEPVTPEPTTAPPATTAEAVTPAPSTEAPPAEEEILEPGELPVSALPATVGEYQLSNFHGLYSYAKEGAAPNTGVSVTDTGGDFLADEALSSIPGAQAIADGRGVCGDPGGQPLCYVGLTEYGSVMVNALDAGTSLDDVVAVAEAVIQTVG